MKLPADFDFDQKGFVKRVSQKFNFKNDDSLFTFNDEDGNEDYGWGDLALDIFNNFLAGYTLGLSTLLGRIFNHNETVNQAKNWIASIQNQFNPKEYLERSITRDKDKIINEVKKEFIDELLDPFQKKLDEIRQQGLDKQKRLEDARKNLEKLEIRKKNVEQQMETIQSMK